MNCREINENMATLVESPATPAASRAVEAHLAGCGRCRSELEQTRDLHERLRRLGQHAPFIGAAEPVMRSLAQSALAGVHTQAQVRARPGQRWAGLLAVAATAIATVVLWPFGGGGNGGAALARVIQQVDATRSVAFRLRMLRDGQTMMTGELIDARGRLRIVEGDGRIGVGDRTTNAALVIDPAERTWWKVDGLAELPDMYGLIRNLEPASRETAESTNLDDRAVQVFRARLLSQPVRVFVDEQSRLPVRMEWRQNAMQPDGRMVEAEVIADEIVWDGPIDDVLLSLSPPDGYAELPSRSASPAPQSGELSLPRQVERLVFGCLQYAGANDGCWPERLDEIAPFVSPGLLRHPDRRDSEIGFEYVKPNGPAIWESAENRRIVVLEHTDGWTGQVVVGFSDGKSEMITDRERFDVLLADAKHRAGRPGSPTRTENRIRAITFACIRWGDAHGGQWPTELSQVKEYVQQGGLRHPQRTQWEIGFVYFRPAGVAGWQSDGQKRLILHERFDEWPGAVTVGFTDGTSEIVTDSARLEELVRAAGGDE